MLLREFENKKEEISLIQQILITLLILTVHSALFDYNIFIEKNNSVYFVQKPIQKFLTYNF